MRYLIILLYIPFFISCGDDEEYSRGVNVVEGIWNSYYLDTDSLVVTRVFTDDYYTYFSFSDNKEQDELNKQRYYVIDNSLVMDNYTQTFSIDADTLWITNSKKDQITKYVRQKESLTELE